MQNIIKDLEDNMKELEEKKRKAEEAMGDEGRILRQKIEAQQSTISDLKIQVKEQQNLMIKLDMARIEEICVLRHSKGKKEVSERQRVAKKGPVVRPV